MPPTEEVGVAEALRRVDAVLARQPEVDGHRCSEALSALAQARDRETEEVRRGGLNLLISLVMAVKHPLGAPPWGALGDARHRFDPAAETGDTRDG